METINPSEFQNRRFVEEREQGKKLTRKLTTSKLSKTVIEALRGQKPHDYEGTARLLVLYVMNTLFLSTSKASMKLAYANYMADMDKLCDFT